MRPHLHSESRKARAIVYGVALLEPDCGGIDISGNSKTNPEIRQKKLWYTPSRVQFLSGSHTYRAARVHRECDKLEKNCPPGVHDAVRVVLHEGSYRRLLRRCVSEMRDVYLTGSDETTMEGIKRIPLANSSHSQYCSQVRREFASGSRQTDSQGSRILAYGRHTPRAFIRVRR